MNEIAKSCLHCGSAMQTQRSTKKYCSESCKQTAFHNRCIQSVEVNDNDQSIEENEDRIENDELQSDKAANDADNVKETMKQAVFVPITEAQSPEDEGYNVEEKTLQLNSNNTKKSSVQKEVIDDKLSVKVLSKNNINTSRHKEIEEDSYEFIKSKIVEAIEEYLEDNDQDAFMLTNTNRYWYGRELEAVKWVSLRFRSIIESMLYLNPLRKFESKHIIKVSEGLKSIINSIYFKSLPANYPFTKRIREMSQKLQKSTKNFTGREIEIEFPPIAFQKKVRLIAMRFQLAQFVPKVKFSTLKF